MQEKEELRKALELELQWVKYRAKMLDIIEKKLQRMEKLAKQAKMNNLSSDELVALNTKINRLSVQVSALDKESRKIILGGIVNKHGN